MPVAVNDSALAAVAMPCTVAGNSSAVSQPGCAGNALRCDKMALAGAADASWAHVDSETEAVAVGVSVVQTCSDNI